MRNRSKMTRGFTATTIGLALVAFCTVLFWPQSQPARAAGPPATANISCKVLWVHDGDTLRCEGYRKSTRLYGIDSPEMPGACREGRSCVPGDPHASKAKLQQLIAGRAVRCQHIETDRYDRPVMRCWADQTDVSCAMVASGHAVERYGKLEC